MKTKTNIMLISCIAVTLLALSGCSGVCTKPIATDPNGCVLPAPDIDKCKLAQLRANGDNLAQSAEHKALVNEQVSVNAALAALNAKIEGEMLAPLREIPEGGLYGEEIAVTGYLKGNRVMYKPVKGRPDRKLEIQTLTLYGAMFEDEVWARVRNVGTSIGQNIIGYMPFKARQVSNGIAIRFDVPAGKMDEMVDRFCPPRPKGKGKSKLDGYKIIKLPFPQQALKLDRRGIQPGMIGAISSFPPASDYLSYVTNLGGGYISIDSPYRFTIMEDLLPAVDLTQPFSK
jgi:hypothetical protein